MKKTIGLLLALVMILSVVACGGGGSSSPPASEAPSSSAPASEAPSSSAQAPESASPPAAAVDPTIIGTIDEDIDHHARRTYKIAYTHYDNSLLEQQMYDAYLTLLDRFNIEIVRMIGNTDDETYITNLQTLIDRGDIDGFIIETTNSVQNAVLDMMAECGIPYVNQWTEYFDADGRVVTPTVGLPQHQSGYEAMKYLIDNYKTYWGEDADPSKFGVIGVDFSVSPALNWRTDGLVDAFRDAFPDNKNVFVNDSFAAGQSYWFALEGGYEPTVQIITANPQVEYWFFGGTVEQYSIGAARAAEELGRDDTMLITTVGHPMIAEEWQNGYDGAEKAVMAISNYAYATPVLLGLIAQIDGRATAETLWPQYKAEGDLCAIFPAEMKVVTKDTYQAFLDDMDRKYGP